jgi:hypothetical protein
VKAPVESPAKAGSTGGLRMLVGRWTQVRNDPAVDELRDGPEGTGVFATFKGQAGSGWHLIGLDAGGTPRRDFGQGSGLVAALGGAGDAPTWIVTGSGGSAVRRAAAALDARSLQNHYAVAATGHTAVPLPIVRMGDPQ